MNWELRLFEIVQENERVGGCVLSKEFYGLHEAESKGLQQKWHKHHIEELKTFSGCLGLLQEECKLCIKYLETTNAIHNS